MPMITRKKNILVLFVMLVGTAAHAKILLESNFDTSVNATNSLGDPNGYANTSLGTPATRPITNAYSKFGVGSFYDYDNGKLLKYKIADNWNWSKGTVEFFVKHVPPVEGYAGYFTGRALMVGPLETSGRLEVRFWDYYGWDNPYTQVLWDANAVDSDSGVTENGNALYATAAPYLDDPNWHHMAITWDMTNANPANNFVEFFADGQRRLSKTGLAPVSVTTGDITVGSHANGNAPIDGYIDDFVVYDTVVYSGSTYTVPTKSRVVPIDCASVWAMGFGLASDMNRDCKVNLADMGSFLDEWLSQNNPANSGGSGFVRTW